MIGMIISVMWSVMLAEGAANAYCKHWLQCAQMELLCCSAGVTVLKGHGWQPQGPLQAADLHQQAAGREA